MADSITAEPPVQESETRPDREIVPAPANATPAKNPCFGDGASADVAPTGRDAIHAQPFRMHVADLRVAPFIQQSFVQQYCDLIGRGTRAAHRCHTQLLNGCANLLEGLSAIFPEDGTVAIIAKNCKDLQNYAIPRPRPAKHSVHNPLEWRNHVAELVHRHVRLPALRPQTA